jgi:hypothetical protein
MRGPHRNTPFVARRGACTKLPYARDGAEKSLPVKQPPGALGRIRTYSEKSTRCPCSWASPHMVPLLGTLMM